MGGSSPMGRNSRKWGKKQQREIVLQKWGSGTLRLMKTDIDCGLIVFSVPIYWFSMHLLSDDSVLDLEMQQRISQRVWLCGLDILKALCISLIRQSTPWGGQYNHPRFISWKSEAYRSLTKPVSGKMGIWTSAAWLQSTLFWPLCYFNTADAWWGRPLFAVPNIWKRELKKVGCGSPLSPMESRMLS